MIQIKNLSKSFGTFQVLKDVSFQMGDGEIVTIIGPSGSGKSTLLRCLNYLEIPQSGSVAFDDKEFIFDKMDKEKILELRRQSSMVFQNYNLIHHRTVLENITDPLTRVKKMQMDEAKTLAMELLNRVGIAEKADEYPRRLSGGQQQRVSIARALAVKPKVILFDEPTSALDPELVKEVLLVIKELAKQKQTMIIVTHEMHFARMISDKVLFLDEGRVAAEGTVEEIFENSGNQRLRNFLEIVNLDKI